MTEPTRFPNAPITEALLDIRVNLPEHVDLAQLATFQDLMYGFIAQILKRPSEASS